MKEISNRSPVIISPKEPFKKWAKFYNELPKAECEQRLKEIHIYLVDWAYGEKLEVVLKPYYREIFENELLLWNSIKTEWPQKINYEFFIEWFEVRFGDDLFDLETQVVETEEL